MSEAVLKMKPSLNATVMTVSVIATVIPANAVKKNRRIGTAWRIWTQMARPVRESIWLTDVINRLSRPEHRGNLNDALVVYLLLIQ